MSDPDSDGQGPEPAPLLQVALDGLAASGKGTIARALGQTFRLSVLETGLIYRSLGRAALQQGLVTLPGRTTAQVGTPIPDLPALCQIARTLRLPIPDPAALGNEHIASAASIVAAEPKIRDLLLGLQRRFAQQPPPLPDGSPAQGALLEGRDIGTRILPHARVKLFITASVDARTARRQAELAGQGGTLSENRIREMLRARDARDRNRHAAPLVAASDARVIDTTHMDPQQAIAKAVQIVRSRMEADPPPA